MSTIEISREERCADKEILSKMLAVSAHIREEEVSVTKKAVEVYTEQEAFRKDFFEKHQYNPGGWNRVFAVKDKAAKLQNEAVRLEVFTMIREQWMSKGWNSTTWAKDLIEKLERERKYLLAYYNSRFKRWEEWRDTGNSIHRALEDKNLEFITLRSGRISREIALVEALESLGLELRGGINPDPNSDEAEANMILCLLYKRKIETAT